MTKVEIAERTEEEIVKSTLKHIERVKEHYENLAPPCPADGQSGTFVEMLVAPPPVTAALYRCVEGHDFSWREGVGAKLLSSQKKTSQ